jgi:hypothetical protein
MVSKIEKTEKVLTRLEEYYREGNEKITRYILRSFVASGAEVTNRHSVSGWINRLLGDGFLSPNPTSAFIRVKANPYQKGGIFPKTTMLMPNNETMYFINIEKIRAFLSQSKSKISHTPLPKQQQSLLGFSKVAIPSKKDNGKSAPN